jgi:hypothetical protein
MSICKNNKKNMEYSKIYKKHKGWKHYLIHDNGGRPFLVYVSPKKKIVDIYKIDYKRKKFNVEEYGKIYTYTIFVKSFRYKKIFIGKSLKNKMTKDSGEYGSKYNGNTILLEISKHKYIYIGEIIGSFKTKQNIIKYYSHVGNNNVPYPYAIDKDGRYYLIINNVILLKMDKKYKNDPYEYYYGDKIKNKRDYNRKYKRLRMKVIHQRI